MGSIAHRNALMRKAQASSSPEEAGDEGEAEEDWSLPVYTRPVLDKPREEYSFYDFHPTLDTTEQLPLVDVAQSPCEDDDDVVIAPGFRAKLLRRSQQPDTAASSTSSQVHDTYTVSKLPVAEVREIEPPRLPSRASSGVYAAYGYQTSEAFTRPDTLIRAEPRTTIMDDAHVEYDMDEQDSAWLHEYNAQRRIAGDDVVSPEMFEIALTRIELEWAEIQKHMPPADRTAEHSMGSHDDASCAVCGVAECTNDNAIVFCDGCNLAVHQECYGVPYIPEGQWLCRKCFISPQAAVACIFCPKRDGAFKQTAEGQWAHIICAMYITELAVGNPTYLEPIENVSGIPLSRWKLMCYICKIRGGACIQCSNKSCYTAMHVTCAQQAELMLTMHSHSATYDAKDYTAYCDRHCPASWHEAHDVAAALRATRASYAKQKHHIPPAMTRKSSSTLSVTAQAAARRPAKLRISVVKNRQGPVVPWVVVERVESAIRAFPLRKKATFVVDMCKYFTLKREARRGASLIRRLQLEQQQQQEYNVPANRAARRERCEFAKSLLRGLGMLREAMQLVRKREACKLEIARMRNRYVELMYMPALEGMERRLAHVRALDKTGMFAELPSRDTPNYYETIPYPISLAEIGERVAQGHYVDAPEMDADLQLMFANARTYNKMTSPFYRTATRVEAGWKALRIDDAGVDECGRCVRMQEIYRADGLKMEEEEWPGETVRAASPLSDVDPQELEWAKRMFDATEPPAAEHSKSVNTRSRSTKRARRG